MIFALVKNIYTFIACFPLLKSEANRRVGQCRGVNLLMPERFTVPLPLALFFSVYRSDVLPFSRYALVFEADTKTEGVAGWAAVHQFGKAVMGVDRERIETEVGFKVHSHRVRVQVAAYGMAFAANSVLALYFAFDVKRAA